MLNSGRPSTSRLRQGNGMRVLVASVHFLVSMTAGRRQPSDLLAATFMDRIPTPEPNRIRKSRIDQSWVSLTTAAVQLRG